MASANGVSATVALQQELGGHLQSGNYAQALKALDRLILEVGSATPQLLCNRAFCYEKLQLKRKALKVWPAEQCCLTTNMHTNP